MAAKKKKQKKKDPRSGKKYNRVARDGKERKFLKSSCDSALKARLEKFCSKGGKGYPYSESRHVVNAVEEYLDKYEAEDKEGESQKEGSE